MTTVEHMRTIEYLQAIASDAGMVVRVGGIDGRSVQLGMDAKKFPNYCEDNWLCHYPTVEEAIAFVRGWVSRPVHDALGVEKKEKKG